MEEGCRLVDAGLNKMEVPVLIIAGTDDRLLESDIEAKRLKEMLPPDRCRVHEVKGGGHIGTLDERVDFLGVVEAWIAQTEQLRTLHERLVIRPANVEARRGSL